MSLVEHAAQTTSENGHKPEKLRLPIATREITLRELRKNPFETENLVFSDLHLGAKYCRTSELLTVLRSVKSAATWVGGDLWDKEYPLHLLTEQDWEAMAALRARPNLHVVRGNHDENVFPPMLTKYLGVEGAELSRVFECSGVKVMVVHGHRFDGVYISPSGSAPQTLVKVADSIVPNLPTIKGLQDRLGNIVYKLNEKTVALCVDHGARLGAQVVIFGHTHHAHQERVNGIDVVNSGGFTGHYFFRNRAFVTVDPAPKGLVCWAIKG